MANYKITDAPKNLSMIDVWGAIQALGGLAKNCRFAVRILPSGTDNLLTRFGYAPFMRDLIYLADDAQYPGRAFEVDEVVYYGPKREFPVKSEYERLTVTFMMRSRGYERKFFDDWMEIINPTNSFDFRYKKQYMASITIFQLSEYAASSSRPNQAVAEYAWNIHDAFPVGIQPVTVNWADPDITRLSVAFSYRYWNRIGLDQSNSTYGPFAPNS